MRPDLERLLESSYRTVVGRIEADPVFCYANRTAQGLWGLTWDEFIRLPSRLSAEPLVQTERDQLLARVRVHGFIDDYQGVRIAKDGTRFRISSAVVWMVVVEGVTHGQAALFREWAPA
jgi:MEKHLA domain